MPERPVSRRTLGGLAAVGLGLPVLTACGGDEGSATASDEAVDPAAAPSSSEPARAVVLGAGDCRARWPRRTTCPWVARRSSPRRAWS